MEFVDMQEVSQLWGKAGSIEHRVKDKFRILDCGLRIEERAKARDTRRLGSLGRITIPEAAGSPYLAISIMIRSFHLSATQGISGGSYGKRW
jgi:hypothetical protein